MPLKMALNVSSYLEFVQGEASYTITTKFEKQSLIIFIIVVLASFTLMLVPLATVKVDEMTSNDFFVFQVIPIPYWLGIIFLVTALIFMIPHLDDKRYQRVFIVGTILLMIGFRIVFPVVFTTIPAYEPDVVDYMKIVSSWVTSGVDFGVQGNYQHNYPLSFLLAYAVIKFGVPIDTFYRFAPFLIYAISIILLFLIVKELIPADKKKISLPFLCALLFSFSSLGYWVTVHYCPDLLGSLMYLLSLYLIIRFVKLDQWKIKNLLPVLISIFFLILSHHLSVLYLIATVFGFSISFWFFKPNEFKRSTLTFFILGIYTYTLWFVYGTLVYPSFFNIYVYFSGFISITLQSVNAGLLANLTFAIYPLFIIALFTVEFLRVMQIKNPFSPKKLRAKLSEIRMTQSLNLILIYTFGFSLVFFLFIVGFGLPVLFGSRILEVLLIGLYPMASQTLLNYTTASSSKKRVIMLLIILFIVLSGVYRYYNQIQRRIILV